MEDIDKILIGPEERKPLEYQVYDKLLIEGIDRANNEIQRIDILEIIDTSHINEEEIIIEHNDDLFISSKEKEPLKNQIVDNILVEGNIKPNNEIQNVDKIDILKTQKPENIIELNDNLFIKSKDKVPLKNQVVDKLLIEGNLKPKNSIQIIDKLEILKLIKPQNVVEQKDDIFLSPKEKEQLEKQSTDKLFIEGDFKPENKIQKVDKMEILKIPKPVNKIEKNENIKILSEQKEKEPLEKQTVDNLFIEKTKRPDNAIQKIDKIELLKCNRPQNTIEQNQNIVILSNKIEKEPLKGQIVDNILIEGDIKKFNNIQKLDNVEILRTTKIKQENIIEEKDNIYIPPEEKEPLNNQVVDNILIEGIEYPQNDIQTIDKIELLTKTKPKSLNEIEEKENIFIPAKEKEPLNKHNIDKLLIEGINRSDNEIQNIDKIYIFENSLTKPKNIIEERENIFIPAKEKEPLENQKLDNIMVEAINKQDNEIQLVDEIEILKTPKPQNKIELNENIFIKPVEKKQLEYKICDNLLIEGIDRPNNEIQNIDKIEIQKGNKPKNEENIIEENCNMFIPHKEKEALMNQKIDNIIVEGDNIPDNEIEIVNEINIPKTEKISENIIEENCNFFIKPREKEPLQYQLLDYMVIEGKEDLTPKKKVQENIIEGTANLICPKEKEPLKKQLTDSILVECYNIPKDILKMKKPENIIEQNSILYISPIEKMPLECQPVDKLYFDKLLPKFSGDKNIIEFSEKFNIAPKESIKKDQKLSLNKTNVPLKIEKSEVNIEGLSNLEEDKDYNDNDNDNNNKIKLRTKYSRKNDNVIQKTENINIKPKEKNEPELINDKKSINNLKEEEKKKPENEIQNNGYLEILKQNKIKDIIIEKKEDFEILPTQIKELNQELMNQKNKEEPKEEKYDKNEDDIGENTLSNKKEPLIEDKMDDLIFDGIIRPKNIIENADKFNIFKTPRPKNEIKNQDKLFISPNKKKILLEYHKLKDLYISGNNKPENIIQQNYHFNIPKVQKEPNKILHLDKIIILPKEKEPLMKENIENFMYGNIISEDNEKENESNNLKNKNRKNEKENEISHIDSIFMEQKEIEPLIKEQLDELPIESEKRPENYIETIKKMTILKRNKPQNEIVKLENIMIFPEKNKIKDVFTNKNNNEIQKTEQIDIQKVIKKPQNEIKSQERIFIPPKEKKALMKENIKVLYFKGDNKLALLRNSKNLLKDKTNDINIEGLVKENLKPENEIKSLEKIFIPSKKKEPLVKESIKDLYLEGNKFLSLSKTNENLLKDKTNDITIEGKKDEKVLHENEIKFQEELFIPSLMKNKLIENDINNIDKIFIPSKEKEPLLEDKINNINIQGIIKNENETQIKQPNNEITNINPIFIAGKKKEPLQKQFTNEVNLLNIINEDENESQILLKGIKPKFINIVEENKDKFFIKGISNIKNNNIKENNDNFFIKGLTESEPKINVEKIKKPYEICSQIESFEIEKNIEPEIYEELYILRNKYKKLKKEIKPIKENNIIIKGETIPKDKINIQNKEQKYQVNTHFSILAERKKPYIIENSPNINILSEKKPNIYNNNNLIVQGTCLGLFGNKKEPGQMTQDIENVIVKNNWNENNRAQRTFTQTIEGNNNKRSWSDYIIRQKGVVFNINKNIKDLDLKIIKENNFYIKREKEKEKEDEIIQDEYNYISLEKEKDDKKRRTVKATITKVYRERKEDDDNIDDLDPFSSCKKHTGKKYDQLFKERKTTSVRIKDDDEIKPGSILIKDDNEKKNENLIYAEKKGGSVIIKEENDIKTGPILFKKKKEKEKEEPNLNKFKDFGKSKSQVMFRSKEKNVEYLRDYDNEPGYFN